MPKPVKKIDPKELEYQEYQRQQAELEQQAWLDAMKRERDEEARMEAYRKRKAEADREIEEMRKNSVNRDEPIPNHALKMILSHSLIFIFNFSKQYMVL